jgi:ATP-binding cassette subfamily F protein uup
VLDEPTNDLDMDTLDGLEEMLAAYDGTILLVSHDRAFLDGVATQVIGALGDGRWAESPGGYADFAREHGAFSRPAVAAKSAPAAPAPERKASRKLSYKDERRLAELERRVPALEAEIAGLEVKLADPAFFSKDQTAFAAASARLEGARAEKDEAETEWLELEDLRESLARE